MKARLSSRRLAVIVAALPAAVVGCADDASTPREERLHAKAEALSSKEVRNRTVEFFSDELGLSLDNVYWGEFHGHTSYSLDALACGALRAEPTRDPRAAYAFARDPKGADLDFVGLSDHAEEPNLGALPDGARDIWAANLQIAREHNNEDPRQGKVFIVFAGWEYTNTRGGAPALGSFRGYGHKNVIFKRLDGLPTQRYGAFGVPVQQKIVPTAYRLWRELAPYAGSGAMPSALTVPHTPAMVGGGHADDHETDWEAMDARFVRNVELLSKWGSAEGPAPGHCAEDDPALMYPADAMDPKKTLRTVLQRKWVETGDERYLLSFIGGSDDHSGRPGNDESDYCGFDYRGGLTGLVASKLTRDALWGAMGQRRTLVGSTGPDRIAALLAARTAGRTLMMGEMGEHDGTLELEVLAAPHAERIEIVVDGCLHRSVQGNAFEGEIALSPGRHFVYARVLKRSGRLTASWTSPIYIEDERSDG